MKCFTNMLPVFLAWSCLLGGSLNLPVSAEGHGGGHCSSGSHSGSGWGRNEGGRAESQHRENEADRRGRNNQLGAQQTAYGGRNYGSMNYGGMNYAGMNYGGMNSGGMNYAGMNYGGMNYGGMNYAGMNYGGMNSGGMNYAGMNYGGMNYGGMNYGGMNYGAIGGMPGVGASASFATGNLLTNPTLSQMTPAQAASALSWGTGAFRPNLGSMGSSSGFTINGMPAGGSTANASYVPMSAVGSSNSGFVSSPDD